MAEPISFTQGETVTFTVTVNDGNGDPIDISGDTFDAEIRSVDDLAVLLAEFTPEILAAVPPEVVQNQVRFTLASDDSFAIAPNMEYGPKGTINATPTAVYIYDVFRITANGLNPDIRRKIAGGLVSVYPAATRITP